MATQHCSGRVRLQGAGRDRESCRITGPDLDAAALQPLIRVADEIDVVLIGQGAEIAPLAPELRRLIEEAGIGVEIMSTPSACRTYNVLLAEARRVAAVLIAL